MSRTVPNTFDNTAMTAEELIALTDAALFTENDEERAKAVETLKRRQREVAAAQRAAKGGPAANN